MGPWEAAQETLSVGVGALAGSTIMLLSVPFSLSVWAGRVNIDPNTNLPNYLAKPKLTGHPKNKEIWMAEERKAVMNERQKSGLNYDPPGTAKAAIEQEARIANFPERGTQEILSEVDWFAMRVPEIRQQFTNARDRYLQPIRRNKNSIIGL